MTRASVALAPLFERLWSDACHAGAVAGGRAAVAPMIVTQRASVLDDSSPIVQEYVVAGGVCGFAWLQFKGTTPFGRWAKETKLASAAYGGGLQISCREFGQSMQRKEAWCYGVAKSLQSFGAYSFGGKQYDFTDVYSCSRMD